MAKSSWDGRPQASTLCHAAKWDPFVTFGDSPGARSLPPLSQGPLRSLPPGPLPSTSPALTVLPREPLVELGGSIQLNCSLDCPNGKVEWKGLDTNLGNILSFPSHSVLQVTNAHVTTRGTKICLGLCQTIVQTSVHLEVYSFPDTLQLDSEPKELVAGQPARLFCTMSKVYPPGGLILSWYRGDQKLETAEPEEDEDEDELLYYRAQLDVPAADVTEGAEFRCQAELFLSQPQRHFQQDRAVAVPVAAVMKPSLELATTPEIPKTEPPSAAETSSTARDPVSTAGPEIPSSPSGTLKLESPAPTENAATALVATAETLTPGWTAPTEIPTAVLAVTSQPPGTEAASLDPADTTRDSITGTSPDLVSWSPSTEPKDATGNSPTPEPISTWRPKSTTHDPLDSPKTKATCNLFIRPVPPKGITGKALNVVCYTECREEVTIQWVKTPLALSWYQEELSEGKSTLRIDRVAPEHQGDYQCVLLSARPQIARLHITVSPDTFSANSAIAVGMAGSLLGLIITGFASHRLWKRLNSRYNVS
ncbi:mucosal addressin cell adhesion molecule 1 isoform X1 [Alligator mississippiensis]|uniref:mucosal addressin cell adhesion molecule 1 isoform X1 n=1 Tax=Alligator mississippiensis TaxID=8496 RepID=UPI0028781325|nr:mucosal addressin cell adhesion molecule 1 isoform X1 [Alligator mississippiensis]